jgi:hypothetical protein
VETVEKSLKATNLLGTTTVKDVYTAVNKTVDNYDPCE